MTDHPHLHTGRYAAVPPDLLARGVTPLGHTAGHPRFALRYDLAANLRLLAPSRDMFKMPRDQFETRYRARLAGHGLDVIAHALARWDTGAGVVLLCYENLSDPGKWCHRTMFARWWAEQTGDVPEEIDAPPPARLF